MKMFLLYSGILKCIYIHAYTFLLDLPQIKKRGQTDSLAPAAKRTCFGNPLKPAGPPRSIFSYLEN